VLQCVRVVIAAPAMFHTSLRILEQNVCCSVLHCVALCCSVLQIAKTPQKISHFLQCFVFSIGLFCKCSKALLKYRIIIAVPASFHVSLTK